MSLIEVRKKEIIDFEDPYATASIPPSAGNGVVPPGLVFSTRIRVGAKAFLKKIGNAVQAGGESSITFYILINKNQRLYPYDGSQNQWGDPSNLQDLPARIPLSQGALFEVYCKNSDGANTWTATARAFIEYEDLA